MQPPTEEEILAKFKELKEGKTQITPQQAEQMQQALMENKADDKVIEDFIKMGVSNLYKNYTNPQQQALDFMKFLQQPYALLCLQQSKFPAIFHRFCMNTLTIDFMKLGKLSSAEKGDLLKENHSIAAFLFTFCAILSEAGLPTSKLVGENDKKWNVRVGVQCFTSLLKSPLVDLTFKHDEKYIPMYVRIVHQLVNHSITLFHIDGKSEILEAADKFIEDAEAAIQRGKSLLNSTQGAKQEVQSRQEEYDALLFSLLQQQGLIYKRQKAYSKAVQVFEKVLKAKPREKNPISYAQTCVNFGNTYVEYATENDDPEKYGIDLFAKPQQQASSTPTTSSSSSAATTVDQKTKYERVQKAIEYLSEAAEIFGEVEEEAMEAVTEMNYGYALLVKTHILLDSSDFVQDGEKEREEAITKAISLFNSALQVIKPPRISEWARLQLYLSESYMAMHAHYSKTNKKTSAELASMVSKAISHLNQVKPALQHTQHGGKLNQKIAKLSTMLSQ